MTLNNLLASPSSFGRTTTLVSDSGEACHPCPSHYIAHVQFNPKETTNCIYVFLKKTIDFHLIQSNHYPSEMLSKHWDLIKILPMTTSLLVTYGSTPFDPKVNIYGNTHDVLINGLSTAPHLSSHHLHTKLHISTYYSACKHNNMSHPPQEGSNRSLAYCTLLGVLWQMFHTWITYGMVGSNVQTMGKLGGTSGKYQEACLFACFWDPYGSVSILGLPIGVL